MRDINMFILGISPYRGLNDPDWILGVVPFDGRKLKFGKENIVRIIQHKKQNEPTIRYFDNKRLRISTIYPGDSRKLKRPRSMNRQRSLARRTDIMRESDDGPPLRIWSDEF